MMAEQNQVYPSVKQAICLIFLYVMSTVLVIIVTNILFNEDAIHDSLPMLCRSLFAAGVTLGFAYLMKRKRGEKFISGFRKTDVKICFWMILIPPLFLFFMLCLMFFIFAFWGSPDTLPLYKSTDIYTFINIVCVTPLFEELLFRGIMLDGFLRRYSFLKAMALSVFFFAILHFSFQILTATFLGILAGYVYFITKSIWPCIMLHVANNLSAYLVMCLDSNSGILTDLYTGNMICYVGVCWLLDISLLSFILYRFFALHKIKYK